MSVRKDESRNRWIATVECGEIRGKRKRIQKSFDKKKDAQRWEREMESASKDLDISEYDMPFSALAKEWIEYKIQKGLEKGTIKKNQHAIAIMENYALFSEKARDIRMSDIEDMFNDLGKRYSKTYIRDIKSTMSSIFSYGVDQCYIMRNPCQRASLPRETQPGRKNIDSFTKEELKAIEDHFSEIPFGDIVYIMVNTGLRAQEICAIDKDSLSMKDKTPYITVNKALKRDGKGGWDVGTTKTESSVREIPVSQKVYDLIIHRIIGNKYQTLIHGRKTKYTSYASFYRNYEKFFEELNRVSDVKVRNLPPHCCRHTFSSRCEWSGVPMTVTKELLGHTSVSMTNKYTHIMNDEKEAAISKFS